MRFIKNDIKQLLVNKTSTQSTPKGKRKNSDCPALQPKAETVAYLKFFARTCNSSVRYYIPEDRRPILN